ncbi:MAG: AMP-binding protein [Ignavibacteriae bacterium]|nr:AMP-binding protein [Ignavibacteriota bacterium]
MNLLQNIFDSFIKFSDRKAFCINDTFYTYNEFKNYVASYNSNIKNILSRDEILVGVITHNDIETYATLFALMFSGYGFVPLNPRNPVERNNGIIEQSEIKHIFSSANYEEYDTINTKNIPVSENKINIPEIDDEKVLCILFTSGSTGIPKGVPYTKKNIDSTLDAFFHLGYDLNEEDKFLQMFEFSFDMSLLSYLPVLCIGACVYTVPEDEIKYLAAYKVMDKYDVTFAAMVPSTLAFLRPYFSDIKLEKVKYSLLGGEPFYVDIAREWFECLPNAQIVNISGPTETTMACMGYNLSKDFLINKSLNDILAFGKPWKNTTAIVVDENNEEVSVGVEGELCFAGDNVMKGYWKMPEVNSNVFFRKNINGKEIDFYKTGDMAKLDEEGDFYSCGRKDFQFKIQGYKVEIGEIEKHVRDFTKLINVAALVYRNNSGVLEIHLYLERYSRDKDGVIEYLKKKVPSYMLPSGITILHAFPTNMNGKIDRKELIEMLKK